MQISDVVLVDVQLAGPAIEATDFSLSLIYVYHNRYTDRVREYAAESWSTVMKAENFVETELAYQSMAAAFKQNPKPAKVKMGRRSAAETQTVRITPVVGPAGTRYSLVIESAAGVKETASIVDDGTPLLAELCTALAAAINALTGAFTAVGTSGTHVDVTSDVANVYFSFRDLANLTLRDTTTSSGISADLDAIQAADSDWYGLALASPAPAAIEACADWIEANSEGAPHIFTASTHDMGVITSASDDIGTSIMGQSYQRTNVHYHSKALQFFGLALQASMLTYEPGEADWSAKTVIGAEPDKLTPTQEGYAKAKRVSTYGALKKQPWTGEAITGSGYFIDLIILKDWIKARLEEFIVAKRKALPKIPLTDKGVGAITLEAMMEVVKLGQENKAIDTDPTTVSYVVPKVLDRPESERKAKQFRGSSVSCRATQGAHLIQIGVNLNV